MTPVKLFLAVLIFALTPSISSAQDLQRAPSLSEELFEAVQLGWLPIVEELVARGANVNYLNNQRVTPMHAAASKGRLEIIRYLKGQRAYLHPRTIKNWTPLHHAVRFGHLEVANYLLSNGAPINLKTSDGVSVFDMARGARNVAMMNILNRYKP